MRDLYKVDRWPCKCGGYTFRCCMCGERFHAYGPSGQPITRGPDDQDLDPDYSACGPCAEEIRAMLVSN